MSGGENKKPIQTATNTTPLVRQQKCFAGLVQPCSTPCLRTARSTASYRSQPDGLVAVVEQTDHDRRVGCRRRANFTEQLDTLPGEWPRECGRVSIYQSGSGIIE